MCDGFTTCSALGVVELVVIDGMVVTQGEKAQICVGELRSGVGQCSSCVVGVSVAPIRDISCACLPMLV